MFDRIVNGMINEDVSSILAKTYNVDASKARELLRSMSFSDYNDLKGALDSENTPKVKAILSNFLNLEGNAYTAARQDTQDMGMGDDSEQMDPVTDISSLNTGDMVMTSGGQSKIDNEQNLGDKRTLSTDDGHYITVSDMPTTSGVPITNPDDAMAEIDRIKQLAGIEDDSMEEEIGSPTPMTCKAMSRDGSTTPNQIIKRHRKDKKPGPKTGSKYGQGKLR